MNKAILTLLVVVVGIVVTIGYMALSNESDGVSSIDNSSPPPLPEGKINDTEASDLSSAYTYAAQLKGMTQQFQRLETDVQKYMENSDQKIEDVIQNAIAQEIPKIEKSLRKEIESQATTPPLNQTNRVLPTEQQSGRLLGASTGPLPAGFGFNEQTTLPFDSLSSKSTKTAPSLPSKPEYLKISAWEPEGTHTRSSSGNSSRVLSKSENQVTRKKDKREPIPYYTIENTATLFSNTTMTALMGVVPTKNNALKNMMRFKIITGAENIASNGLYLPDIKNIVWTGYAVGIREASCIQATVDTVTYTFQDGTISTYSKKAGSGGSKLNEGLGYLSDKWGKPCIKGTLISNASEYLRDRMIAAGAAATASAAAATETTTTRDALGGVSTAVTGDSTDFILGKTGTATLNELADYLRERMDQAIDIVYLDAGVDVVVHVEEEIPINYDPEGRKLAHNQSDLSIQLTKHRLD